MDAGQVIRRAMRMGASERRGTAMMDVEGRIRSKLIEELSPTRLKIDNDSKRHAGPATDTHFRLVVVSEADGPTASRNCG